MFRLVSPYKYDDRYFMQSLVHYDLPSTIYLAGVTYVAKPEFHCSLLAVKRLIPRLVTDHWISEDEAENLCVDAIQEVLTEVQPAFDGFTLEFRVATKPAEAKQTIVGMIKIVGLAEFLEKISSHIGLDIPMPTPHVTLYTLENGLPIGLTSQAEFDTLSRPMTEAEERDWKSSVRIEILSGVTS